MVRSITVGSIIDSMPPDERDVFDIIVGAALASDTIQDLNVINSYNELSVIKKQIIDFVVGNATSENYEFKHAEEDKDFLTHFGVKGMRWGVRKTESGGSRLREGKGSNNEVSLAKHKTNGHRAVNALLGDKTFWNRMAITAGMSVAGWGAAGFGVPHLPTSFLTSIGEAVGGPASAKDGLYYQKGTTYFGPKDVGILITSFSTVAATGVGAAASVAVNVPSNVARAIKGNPKQEVAVEKLGKEVIRRQKNGRDRVKNATDSQVAVHAFLEHHGIKGMKWGRRRTDAQLRNSGSTSSSSKKTRSPELEAKLKTAKRSAIVIAKAAAVPIASATGIGAVGTLGLGISMRVLSDPTVQSALGDVGTFSKETFGDVKMSALNQYSKIPFVANYIEKTERMEADGRRMDKENQQIIKRQTDFQSKLQSDLEAADREYLANLTKQVETQKKINDTYK